MGGQWVGRQVCVCGGVCLGHGRPVGWQVSGCWCGCMTGTWEASGSVGKCVCVGMYDWDMGGQWVGR